MGRELVLVAGLSPADAALIHREALRGLLPRIDAAQFDAYSDDPWPRRCCVPTIASCLWPGRRWRAAVQGGSDEVSGLLEVRPLAERLIGDGDGRVVAAVHDDLDADLGPSKYSSATSATEATRWLAVARAANA
ncbi:hypothetical protein [Streptomyces sp. NPDC047434]|uniref:hypothetical protein n=1 Tax=Streptomyces sp. NPDC047434 TaxID=3155143 RepID=UPI0033EDFB67